MTSRVPIVTRDGQVGSVDEADLGAALRAGATPASPEEVSRTQAEEYSTEHYGPVAGPLAAAQAGLIRAGTLGLSDAALRAGAKALGGDATARSIMGEARTLREGNPLADTAGEVVGTVAPMLAGGAGASRLIPGVGVSSLGRGAESLALRALPAAEGFVGNVARKTVAGAVGSAVEGAAYGAGHAISEAALDDHELTAEELYSAMGETALFGGVLGGATHAGLAIPGEALRAGMRGGRALASKVDAYAERLVTGPDPLQGLEGLAGRARQKVGDLLDGAPSLEALDRKASDFIDKNVDLQKLSDEQAARATYARKKFVDEANVRFKPGAEGEPGGWAGVGRVMKETGVIDTKAGVIENALSPEDLAPRIEKALEERGKRLGQIAEQSGARVDAKVISDQIDDVIAPFRKMAGRDGLVGSLEGYQRSLLDKLGALDKDGNLVAGHAIPVQDLRAQRINLQDMAYQEAKSLDPGQRVAQLREFRKRLADLEVDALSASKPGEVQMLAGVDPAAFGPAKDVIKKLNREYQALRIAQDATEDAISRGGANRTPGATDYLSFVAGSAAGGPILGGGMAIANKIARERGSAAASVFLHDLNETKSLAAAVKRATKAGHPYAERLRDELGQTMAKLEDAHVLDRVAQITTGVKKTMGETVDAIVTQASHAGASAARAAETVGRVARKAGDVRTAAFLRGYTSAQDFRRQADQVKELSTDPSIVAQRVGAKTDALARSAPDLAGAVGMLAQGDVDYLASLLPRDMNDPDSLTPFAKRPESAQLSVAQMRWMRAKRALDDPPSVLEDVFRGHLAPEAAEALRVRRPRMYEAIRGAIMTRVTQRPPSEGPLPWQTQKQLAILLAIPTSRILTPAFTRAMQATTDAKPAPQPQGQPSAPQLRAKPLGISAATFRTPTETAELYSGGRPRTR